MMWSKRLQVNIRCRTGGPSPQVNTIRSLQNAGEHDEADKLADEHDDVEQADPPSR